MERRDRRSPFEAAELAQTLRPPEQATMLPPAAFTDTSVFEWELANLFSGWICVGHVSQVAERGQLPGARDRPRQRRRHRRRGRPAPGLPQRLPPSGSRVVAGPQGRVGRRLPVPPIAPGGMTWMRLAPAAPPTSNGSPNFDRSCSALVPVRLAVVGGLLLVDLGGEAPDKSRACRGDTRATSSATGARSCGVADDVDYEGRRELEEIG